jgi:hypothetical protein
MNNKLKLLAEQAGFCLWGDEPYNPGDVIDWSARYDAELLKFYRLMIAEFYSVIDETVKDRSITTFDSSYLNHFRDSLKEKFEKKFNI